MSAITLRDIDFAVAQAFSVDREVLKRRTQKYSASYPRMAAYALAREFTPHSYPRIGDHYHRDHTTVLAGARRARALQERDGEFAEELRAARETLLAAQADGTLLRDAIRAKFRPAPIDPSLSATWC